MNLTPLTELEDAAFLALAEAAAAVSVSIIMPVEQEPDKRDTNRIRLKNQLRRAGENLAGRGLRPPEISPLLHPAQTLIAGGRFPILESPGLAIYLADDFQAAYQLPLTPEQTTTTGTHFHLRPLLRLRVPEHFYILALSQAEVRLLRATRYGVEPVTLTDPPESLSEMLRWDDPEKQLQWHTGTGAANSGRAAMYHGHGVGTGEVRKDNLLRFFHLVNDRISAALAGTNAPLVLAGVDYLLPIYREAGTYPHVIDEALTGNPEELSDRELHAQAWPLVRSLAQRPRLAALESYAPSSSHAATADQIEAVVPAAYQGRVDTLFIAEGARQWGVYDPATNRIEQHADQQPADDDLLNVAAIYTAQNSGSVYECSRGDMPGDGSLAAILRY